VRASMPAGTLLEIGGTVEKSDQSNAAILAQVTPELHHERGEQSFRKLALVISVATGTPLGFIAILGSIALAGMIIRNSVILVHQIEHERVGV
jgi:hypothetical protein